MERVVATGPFVSLPTQVRRALWGTSTDLRTKPPILTHTGSFKPKCTQKNKSHELQCPLDVMSLTTQSTASLKPPTSDHFDSSQKQSLQALSKNKPHSFVMDGWSWNNSNLHLTSMHKSLSSRSEKLCPYTPKK